ncbi:hypothetical protein C4D60_Mb05t21090 [Musa balbisiana]|uniref:Uncharacterized protein n=1 Tax=Musa balbisiana TaxID=52838 RepID=A0A4S8JXR2_MUSBA|nr:hypothetical protein C4D60_Mb05t21090 [Musa balbisiana]
MRYIEKRDKKLLCPGFKKNPLAPFPAASKRWSESLTICLVMCTSDDAHGRFKQEQPKTKQIKVDINCCDFTKWVMPEDKAGREEDSSMNAQWRTVF